MTPTRTISERLKAALDENAKIPPAERADDMVRRGVVNSKGEVTTLIGGDAEPENEP